MKAVGKFFLIVGILMCGLLFLTGSVVTELKRDLSAKNQGFLNSLGNELSGANAQEREQINMLAGFNRLLMGGGTICVVVGIAGLIAGSGKKPEAGQWKSQ
jgi:hypothetical protein